MTSCSTKQSSKNKRRTTWPPRPPRPPHNHTPQPIQSPPSTRNAIQHHQTQRNHNTALAMPRSIITMENQYSNHHTSYHQPHRPPHQPRRCRRGTPVPSSLLALPLARRLPFPFGAAARAPLPVPTWRCREPARSSTPLALPLARPSEFPLGVAACKPVAVPVCAPVPLRAWRWR